MGAKLNHARWNMEDGTWKMEDVTWEMMIGEYIEDIPSEVAGY